MCNNLVLVCTYIYPHIVTHIVVISCRQKLSLATVVSKQQKAMINNHPSKGEGDVHCVCQGHGETTCKDFSLMHDVCA